MQGALSGFSDLPMRRVARAFGCLYAMNEVVLDELVVLPGKLQQRILHVEDDDHPVGGQLLGSMPETFASAASLLVDAGYDVVDINMGCPVQKVLGRSRGGFLLSEPRTALEIVSRVREAVRPEVPVTVKMRRGVDDGTHAEDMFWEILEGAFARGISAVCVHGRTVAQRYVGPSKRSFLADVKARFPDRVILGSGDLYVADDVKAVLEQTKVDGAWTPDGQHIVLAAEGKPHRRIGLYHLEDGRIDWLLDDPTRNIEDAVWLRRTEHLIIEEVRDARAVISLLDPATRLEQPFKPGAGTFDPIGMTADGHWVAWHYAAQFPTRLVRLEKAAPYAVAGVLAEHPTRPGIAASDLAAAEDYRWKSVDGLDIQGWLYRAKQPRGTILLVHGGPTHHDEDEFDVEIQYYVACGFHVLTPNYRGSTGFGLAYEESIKQQGWGGLEQADIRAGAEELIRDGIAERGRIGITGTSYGGYSSWWAITHFPTDIIAAAAPICGMTDLVVDYETTRPDLRPYSEEMMGGSPQQAPERYRERSPIHFVGDIKGKLLIIQGDNDPNVTPQNVTDVISRLKGAGIDYELLTFDDEGHGIGRPANQRILYRRIADFFARAFATS